MTLLKCNYRLCIVALRTLFKPPSNIPYAGIYYKDGEIVRRNDLLVVQRRFTSSGSNPSSTAENVSKSYLMAEFFDEQENWGKTELRPLYRPGRSWTSDELRLKSNVDLHKLWYVLLKERNMLLTMQTAYVTRARFFPNVERLDRVKESMNNIEEVVHERNDAFIQLETGDSASPPERTVTSFMGFDYKKQSAEHYEPAEISGKKEYEVPYLDEDAYLMQRMWKEKEHIKKEIADYDTYFNKTFDAQNLKFGRTIRRYYDRLEDLPKNVLAKTKNS